jgi:hypothetical protein
MLETALVFPSELESAHQFDSFGNLLAS